MTTEFAEVAALFRLVQEALARHWSSDATIRRATVAVLAALRDRYELVPKGGLPEFRCPSCRAVIRARMADHVERCPQCVVLGAERCEHWEGRWPT